MMTILRVIFLVLSELDWLGLKFLRYLFVFDMRFSGFTK